MQAPAQHEPVLALEEYLVARGQPETRDERAQVRIRPTDLTDRRLERPMLGLDRAEAPAHGRGGFEELHVVTRTRQT